MELRIHPDAAANLDKKAEALLAQLAPAPERELRPGFKPEPYVSHTLSEADIVGPIRFGLVDYTGREVAKFFQSGESWIGLQGAAFEDLCRIAEALQRTNELRRRVSTKAVIDLILEWIEKRHHGIEQRPMCEYVLARSAASVAAQEVWIPITRLHIESDFPLGHVVFKNISPQLFDRWRAEILGRAGEHADKMDEWLTRERQRAQGLAAATIVIEAEVERALEIAFAEAHDAVAMLRVFEGANLDPQLVSQCVPLGAGAHEKRHYLLVRDGTLVQTGSGVSGGVTPPWILDNEGLKLFKSAGLDVLDRLLRSDQRTAFHEQLLDALRIYSRSSLAREPSDKLIYILVALESIFVRNETEPLQQNIAERLAFFLAQELEQRRNIIQTVKEAYGLRSAFLHHGRKLEDLQALKRFMGVAFGCMLGLIRRADQFESRETFHKALDDERLS